MDWHIDIKLENILVRRDTCILIDTDTCESAMEMYYTGTATIYHQRHWCNVFYVIRVARSEKMFWLDCYALGKVLAKILLVVLCIRMSVVSGTWVDRERASPSAVRVLLTQRRSTPWWNTSIGGVSRTSNNF